MFERFTDRARRVVVLAQEEARMLEHDYIGSEHLLLGLVHEAEGVAAKALANQGIDLSSVRERVEEIVPTGSGAAPLNAHVPFTARAKTCLAQALREAILMGHNYIGTEHLLLGLITEGKKATGLAAWDVLMASGLDVDQLRRDIQEMVGPANAPVSQPRSWAGILSDWAHADDDTPLDFGGAAVPEKIQRLLTDGVRPSTPIGMGEEIEIQIMGKVRKLVLDTVHLEGTELQAIFKERQ